jgi:hypothetical protein
MMASLQPSSMESGQEDVSQVEQNKFWKGDRNTEDECYTKKTEGATSILPTTVATDNFFAPLDAETGNEGNSTKTPGTNHPPAEANLISLQRTIKCHERDLPEHCSRNLYNN